MGKLFGRDVDVPPLKRTTLRIDALDCDVILQEVDIGELQKAKDSLQSSAAQMALSIVDEDGNRLYTTKEQIATLAKLAASIAGPILAAINDLNGMSKDAIDQMKKNSTASQSDDSESV